MKSFRHKQIPLSSFWLMNVSGQGFLPWFACEKSRRNSRVSISLEPHEFSWRCSFALARDILHCSIWNCWTVDTSYPHFRHELFKSIREYSYHHNKTSLILVLHCKLGQLCRQAYSNVNQGSSMPIWPQSCQYYPSSNFQITHVKINIRKEALVSNCLNSKALGGLIALISAALTLS